MKPCDLFKLIQDSSYTTSGLSLDWTIYIDHENKRVYLLFQETCGKFDWKMNLDFPAVPYKQQEHVFRIHQGWAKVWKSANDTVMAAFIAACQKYPEYYPTVGGWSYGGSITPVAAEDYNYRANKISGLIARPDIMTFGGPKPLYGEDTRAYFQGCIRNSWQFTEIRDCVCLQPPFPGYCRISTEYVGTDKNILGYFDPWKHHTQYGRESIYPEKYKNIV
jgi:hypothetical protein